MIGRKLIQENGFLLVSNLFTVEEINLFRKEVFDFLKRPNQNKNAGGITIPDFIIHPEFQQTKNIINNPKINAVLKDIFDGDNYRFCRYNDIGINRIVGWHKDKLNGQYASYETTDIWSTTESGDQHEIVKVLIYLEDHSKDNDSLKLIPGSHLTREINSNGFIQMRPKLGDVLIFDQRITHRGMERQIQSPRLLISFGFGKNNIFTDNFEKGTIQLQNDQNKQALIKKIRVAHIYACNAKHNSGDFMIGIAYKYYFKEKILKNDNVEFFDLDCRNNNLFNISNIDRLNSFDYILVGGGGLILPDSGTNLNSGWQWNITNEAMEKITAPIYVLSIGYNLFFGQDMTMYLRENDKSNPNLLDLFKSSITMLINKAKIFTLRHKDDCEKLISIVGEDYRNKISYEICATVWYVDKYWKNTIQNSSKDKYLAIEVKDDREWRRYYKIGKSMYYQELEKVTRHCIENNIKILYLSHDGSKNFYNYLISKGIQIPYLDNTSGNENNIKENYSKIHTILCSAGHSQMISDGCGIKILSLVTHPKIRNYCDDIENNNFIDVNNLTKPNEIFNKIVKLLEKKIVLNIEQTKNPHLNIITNYESVIKKQIEECKRELNKSTLKLLDIGGGKGWGKVLYQRSDINYYALDLNCSHKTDNITFIKGDITEKKLNLNEEFDIIFTKDTFEHILNPWDATENILSHLSNNGRFIFLAPFSWRYHASPYDTYRYSHTGAQYLFERLGKMKKIMSGYIKFGNISGFWKNGKDHTIDNEPFPKSLEVMYIGKKDDDYIFSKNCLDSDFSWDHNS